jgi:hypothetical protein
MEKILFILIFSLILLPVVCFAEQIDINSATLAQLDRLTGIGPVMGQRIIDARPFSSVDNLDRVKGIGPATLQKIKDQGLACVNCGSSIIAPTAAPIISPATTHVPSPATSPTATPVIIYPTGVFINEILPNPKGADETDEWIVPTIRQIASVCS